MMKNILVIVLLCLGGAWGAYAGNVLAAQSQAGRVNGQSITARDFERVIFAALTRQYGRPHHRMAIKILVPKKPLPIQGGKFHLELEQLHGGARTGRRSFRVGLYINGQFTKTINVVSHVKVRANVTVPVRWIRPKEVIGVDDVISITVDVPSLTHNFILDAEDVLGKQVLRPLPPRRPIQKSMVDDPPLVRKGDRVMMEVRLGGLIVQTIGLAKGAGKSGDRILVKNQNSGREVMGTIVSAGLVEVGF